MLRMALLLILGIVCCVAYIEALECGILDHVAEERFQDAMKKCANKDDSEEDKDSIESSENLKAGSNKKINKRSTEDTASHENSSHVLSQNETDVSEKCLLHCIYTNLNMVDPSGYPTEQHLTRVLLQYSKSKDARDFLEDSIEECFKPLKKGKKLDVCEYSTQLTNCLAEKGQKNCSDWEPTNLTIHH